MDNSTWSLASLGLDGEDLICFDPVAVAQAINRAISKMTDGEVASSVLRLGLNIRSNARVLRHRLERYQIRRHFGSGAAPWNPVIDERFEMLEPRLSSSFPPNSSNSVGNVSRAKVFEIPTSTGIFRPNVSAISDVPWKRRGSTVAADEISDRSKLNHQPHADSTRYPFRFFCATGNSCFSPSSMDSTRVASVPILVPSCSTAESAPVYASPTCGSNSLPPKPASLEAVQLVEISNENSNAAPAVVSNPSLSRSCSRISFVKDDNVRPPATEFPPSHISDGGFVRELEIASPSEVLSHPASLNCECSLKVQQISKTLHEVREVLDQLKLSLCLGKQVNRPYTKRSSSYRSYPVRKSVEIHQQLKSLSKKEELRRVAPEAYRTPPPPDESFFTVPADATPKLCRQAKLASSKLIGIDLLPISKFKSLAAISPLPVAKVESSLLTSSRVGKVAKIKKVKHPKGLGKQVKQPKFAKAEANQSEEVISSVQKQEQVRFGGVSPQARTWEIRRRKNVEPCFRCSQVGHWQRECVNAIEKQSCGQLSNSLAAMTVIEKLEDVDLVKPSREAGHARPGCWNCREFGHGRTVCPLPRRRVCYMCGQADVTIATCRTCCKEWGQRQLRRLRK